ncbi:MAG: L28 family ribosomal protein [Patescibacteria group bacterium]
MVMICQDCQRSPRVGQSRSHSMAATKRVLKLNLQKVGGRTICTRCQRTQTKKRAHWPA